MGTLTFQAALGGSVNLLGPNTASNINFTLPSADGTSGQPLQTNGSGTLSFANLAIANGGTGATSFTANQIHYGSFSQSAGLTFDGTNFATTGTATATKLIPTGTSVTGNGMYLPATNSLGFSTAGAEAMRIDSSGNLLINTTTSPTYAIQTGTTKNGSPNVRWEYGPSIVNASYYVIPAGGGSGVYINSGNTSWSSNSDARLKNVTGTYANAIADVLQLEPVKFTWKSDLSNKPQVGLIAQSVQKVVPEAVDTDAISGVIGDDEKYLSVRYTEVIPLLVAAIQEQQALITSLTARIEALEAK
jgi:Chaperone of endosialidase